MGINGVRKRNSASQKGVFSRPSDDSVDFLPVRWCGPSRC